MKLFPILGGIHPEYRKELTSEKAIVVMPMPAALYIPLQQHIGKSFICDCSFSARGQLLAWSAYFQFRAWANASCAASPSPEPSRWHRWGRP